MSLKTVLGVGAGLAAAAGGKSYFDKKKRDESRKRMGELTVACMKNKWQHPTCKKYDAAVSKSIRSTLEKLRNR